MCIRDRGYGFFDQIGCETNRDLTEAIGKIVEDDSSGFSPPLSAIFSSVVAPVMAEDGDGYGFFAPLTPLAAEPVAETVMAEEGDGFGFFLPLRPSASELLPAIAAVVPPTPPAPVENPVPLPELSLIHI